jgi:hypothetical protein
MFCVGAKTKRAAEEFEAMPVKSFLERSMKGWTDADDERLRGPLFKGMDVRELASELG